ncbi:Estradiol 17-beta-dehydrogenase 11 [Chionoecetes opilio]|uniref:Short-chain dehydrogenase/reductase 3 n=1 Tax=Chionoecetes opilio TaxID=41210 RepID=A0A8J5CL13_CHIOP|nr:Estradiol 17-beta-dehydrogenase 11 [Chionoecetes opilio]
MSKRVCSSMTPTMLGIIMVVYQYVLLCCDFVNLLFRAVLLSCLALWRAVRPPPLDSMAGEIVLVTGAGHGIGRELSLQFARLGGRVVCLDIHEGTAADILREGGTAWAFCCDVANRDDVATVSAKVRQEVGEVTVLVNNAGIMPCKPFLKHSPDQIIDVFRVNVFAHFWMIQEWLPSFIAAGQGRIVAMSSIAGLVATANLAPYCASKFAVRGLMEGLTEELRYAGRNPHIRLTCVYPFVVDTGLAHNPRIRFPSLNPVTSPAQCAAHIIEGVRRGEECHAEEVRKAFLDFMDTGVDED